MSVVVRQVTPSTNPTSGYALVFLTSLLLASTSCHQIEEPQPDSGEEVLTVDLHGRIVNLETCSGGNGCRPVAGVRARLRTLPAYVSEPTNDPGRFVLTVPTLHEDDIQIDPGDYPFALTLNPWAAPPAISDVYQLELYTLPTGPGTILTDLTDLPEPISLISHGGQLGEGGYVGQVLRRDEDGNHAVLGATVEVILSEDWPTDVAPPEVRYIQDLPGWGDDLLYPEETNATGPPGIFIVPTRGQTAHITVHVESLDGTTIYREVVAFVSPGMVTLGIHTP